MLAAPSGVLERMERSTRQIERSVFVEKRGAVAQVIGLVIEANGPAAAVGDVCRIETGENESILAEVVGFRSGRVLLMPLGDLHGIKPGSPVVAIGRSLEVRVGPELKGRVLNGLGHPMDHSGMPELSARMPIQAQPPHPLKRRRIDLPLETGVKALDTFVPCGLGQRLGIFAGSGVGKSTLLGMLASHASADVNVIALIGERGREVREFIEKDLTAEGRQKSILIVATSDQPALVRLKGAFVAMAIAEYFRDAGQNVLLMMDSITRFALAQREVGLAVGEPPATRGFTPSVFALLPQLLERAGAGETGSITGLFTVLVEGDDMNDPVADAVRAILDGHIVLSRQLATENHYPAIDVLESVSRLQRELASPDQQRLAGHARNVLALLRRNQDLVNIGAYAPGSNPELDEALRLQPEMRTFLQQEIGEGYALPESWKALERALAVPAQK